MRYYPILIFFLLSCSKNGFHEEVIKGNEVAFGNYTDGLKDGKWIHMFASDTHRIKYYNNGVLFRTDFFAYTHYDTNLETRSTRKVMTENYLDSVKHGLKVHYYKGSVKNSWNYAKGKLHGKSKTYDSLGNIKAESEYLYDSMIDFKQYHSNGTLFISTSNPKNGIVEYYDSLGTLISIVRNQEYQPIDTLK